MLILLIRELNIPMDVRKSLWDYLQSKLLFNISKAFRCKCQHFPSHSTSLNIWNINSLSVLNIWALAFKKSLPWHATFGTFARKVFLKFGSGMRCFLWKKIWENVSLKTFPESKTLFDKYPWFFWLFFTCLEPKSRLVQEAQVFNLEMRIL